MDKSALFILNTIGPLALAFVAAAVWLTAHLSAAPGEVVEALWGMVKYHKRGARKAFDSVADKEKVFPGGSAHGEWLQVTSVGGANYVYSLFLVQTGIAIAGTASVTRTGVPDGYSQHFDVSGTDVAGYVALTFRSSDANSLSIASALLRSTYRGQRLEGQWLYRPNSSDTVRAEDLVLSRKADLSPSGSSARRGVARDSL